MSIQRYKSKINFTEDHLRKVAGKDGLCLGRDVTVFEESYGRIENENRKLIGILWDLWEPLTKMTGFSDNDLYKLFGVWLKRKLEE